MSKYKLIALIGEAGSGKDFLLRCSRSQYPEYNEIVSCTTRPPRMGEVDKINYHFMNDKTFIDIIEKGQMLEHTVFNGWRYGTEEASLNPNKVNIGVFNPEGIRSLLKFKDLIDLRVFYVRAPAKVRLIRQLNREDDPNVEEVIRRYQTDKQDFSKLDFKYTDLPNYSIKDVDYCMALLAWPEYSGDSRAKQDN